MNLSFFTKKNMNITQSTQIGLRKFTPYTHTHSHTQSD